MGRYGQLWPNCRSIGSMMLFDTYPRGKIEFVQFSGYFFILMFTYV